MRRVKNPGENQNYMDLIFVPKDGIHFSVSKEGIVTVDMENTGFYNRLAQKLFRRPRTSHIALDEYGSGLWLLLDGKRSVYDVILSMQKTFPEEADMTKRVVTFLGQLERFGWVERIG